MHEHFQEAFFKMDFFFLNIFGQIKPVLIQVPIGNCSCKRIPICHALDILSNIPICDVCVCGIWINGFTRPTQLNWIVVVAVAFDFYFFLIHSIALCLWIGVLWVITWDVNFPYSRNNKKDKKDIQTLTHTHTPTFNKTTIQLNRCFQCKLK